jgi:hypothetical protein
VDGEEDTQMLFLQDVKMPNLPVGQLMKHIAANAGRLATVTAEQTVERRDPVQPSNLFGYAVGSQQIAHPSVCADDAQCDAPGGKFAV